MAKIVSFYETVKSPTVDKARTPRRRRFAIYLTFSSKSQVNMRELI